MGWEAPPYQPKSDETDYQNYEHYMHVTLEQSYEKIINELGNVPAGVGIYIIITQLMPCVEFKQEAEVAQPSAVQQKDAQALNNISAINSDFTNIGSILYSNYDPTDGNFNMTPGDAAEQQIDSDCLDAANQLTDLYNNILVPAYQNAGNTGKPTSNDDTFGGPFGSVAQDLATQITNATGVNLHDLSTDTPEELQGIILNTWKTAWKGSFSSAHYSGNPAPINSINTAIAAMTQSMTGINTQVMAVVKMNEQLESMILDVAQSVEKNFIQGVQIATQHMASASS